MIESFNQNSLLQRNLKWMRGREWYSKCDNSGFQEDIVHDSNAGVFQFVLRWNENRFGPLQRQTDGMLCNLEIEHLHSGSSSLLQVIFHDMGCPVGLEFILNFLNAFDLFCTRVWHPSKEILQRIVTDRLVYIVEQMARSNTSESTAWM